MIECGHVASMVEGQMSRMVVPTPAYLRHLTANSLKKAGLTLEDETGEVQRNEKGRVTAVYLNGVELPKIARKKLFYPPSKRATRRNKKNRHHVPPPRINHRRCRNRATRI